MEHYSDFFKHENSELQLRKMTKEKMVRLFCVYVKLTKLKKLSTLWTLFLPLYDKSCKIWIKKEIKISFFFYKNGPLWSARSGRGNRWERGLAAKANAKDLKRGKGELIKFWALENCKFSWIEKMVPLYIHCPWLLPCIKKVAIEPSIRSPLRLWKWTPYQGL